MKLQSLHIGLEVRHPQYGLGRVKSINELNAEILFTEGIRTVDPEASGLQPAEPTAHLSSLDKPLAHLIDQMVRSTVEALGIEKPGNQDEVEQLSQRWAKGLLVLHPSGAGLQTKEVPLETFFHKIVMVRDNLRVMEQKINSNKTLSDAEKIELQQYITRIYGSLTTFNLLFRDKEHYF